MEYSEASGATMSNFSEIVLDVHPGQKWPYKSEAECYHLLGEQSQDPSDDQVYCDKTFDGVLCWPAVPAYTIIKQKCPPMQGLDTSKYGIRTCRGDGLWATNPEKPGDNPTGWTDYYGCYRKETLEIFKEIFGSESSVILKRVANAVKFIEFIGLTLSLLSLLLSIGIFCYFRSLRCHRTRIHRNLFAAISLHVVVALIVDIDELIGKSTGVEIAGTTLAHYGMINNTPILCAILRRVLIEYTKTVMFMWMFVEGMYLHNTLVISVFSGKPNYVLYYCLGWGFPVILTLAWSIPTAIYEKDKCWFGYTFRPLYWIIEGPRAAIILVNLGFLLNIIRVLVTKLNDSNSNEALRVRKAVKAAIVLLPLLGVNNSLSLVEAPMDDAIAFGVFQILYTFLTSFQGFFIALLYCFLNGEVQHTLRRYWIEPYQTSRTIPSRRVSSNVKQTLGKRWERYMMKKQYAPGQSRVERTQSVFYSVSEAFTPEIKSEVVTLMNGHKQNGVNSSVETHNEDCSL